jgi:hypothetical protein
MFVAIFLLVEERAFDDRAGRGSWAQILVATAMAHAELMVAFFFFVSYAAFVLITGRARQQWKPVLAKTVLPLGLALLVFAGQVTWVRIRYPDTPIRGSGFLTRSGFDGSSKYYGGHEDIAFGRDHARKTFRANRELLLRWKWLFIAGLVALAALIAGYFRSRTPRFVMLALVSMAGSYVLYAAVFSQAVAIHPYLYDIVLAVPLIVALFAAAPSLLEAATQRSGTIVLIAFLGAFWTAMVQVRAYALRYPLPQTLAESRAPSSPASSNVVSSGAIYERGRPRAVGEWITIPYDASLFSAESGARWTVDPGDVTTLAYTLVGNTMTVAFRINGSSISGGSPVALLVAIPEGLRGTRSITNNILVDNVGQQSGFAQVAAGSRQIQIFRLPAVPWTPNQDKTRVIGQITFDVR